MHTPRLLDQLARLTSIHDLELLEFSLLKTLFGFLLPKSLAVVHLDAHSRPIKHISYGGNNCTVQREDLVLSDDLRYADDYLTSSDAAELATPCAEGVRLVIRMVETRYGRSYLLLTLSQGLTKIDAHLVSGVLQIYRNFCAILQSSQTDNLTGLSNRKTFDDCVARVHELIPPHMEAEPGERRQDVAMRYWLVMVDIDHFKLVNDRFGHLYGDEVLVLLARLMKSAFREDDMIFRFGGEEFVLIIRCPSQQHCSIALERFRARVADHKFPQVGKVTISLGAIQMSRDTFTGTLLDYADQALYHSKHSGRDQVTFFEDLLACGMVQVENVVPGGMDIFPE